MKIKTLEQLKKETKSIQIVEDNVSRALESIQSYLLMGLEKCKTYIVYKLKTDYVIPGLKKDIARKYIYYYIFTELKNAGYNFYYFATKNGGYAIKILLTGAAPKKLNDFLDKSLDEFKKK